MFQQISLDYNFFITFFVFITLFNSPLIILKFILCFLANFYISAGFSQTFDLFLHSKPISDNFLKWTKKGKTGILSVEKTKKIFDLNPAHLTVSFPFPDGEKTIEFEQNNIHAPGFQVFDSKNKSIEGVLKMPVHFKGKNNKRGVETSSLSIFSNGEIVLVYSDKNGNINIARLQENIGASNEYIIFNEADLMDKNPFACNADELPKINNNNSNIPNPN